jgi:diguanylate cyclase
MCSAGVRCDISRVGFVPFEFDPYVVLLVVGSTLAGVVIGYLIRPGQGRRVVKPPPADTKAALKALLEILKGVERLTSDVDIHNTEIRNVGRHIGDLKVSGELRDIQKAILGEITHLLSSNQRLEDDLVVATYHMERQAEELDRTRREARTDTLAGIGNRKAFDESLQWLLTTWKRTGEPFVLILGDLDRFKWINDTHGHTIGDRVLQQMANLLKQSLREGDLVTRYGGDEFGLLLPKTELKAGVQIAARMGGKVWTHSFDLGGRGTQGVVSFSLGVAGPCEGDTVESIVHRADRALYKAKEMGRNRCYWSSGLDSDAGPSQVQDAEPAQVALPQA